MIGRHPARPLFPYTTLFRSFARGGGDADTPGLGLGLAIVRALARAHGGEARHEAPAGGGASFVVTLPVSTDRKSTRLNSSHLGISYAVFCLKKKNRRTGPRL